MEIKSLTCVVCPMGCRLEARVDGGKIISLTGGACKRGEPYAVSELSDPRRTLTTTVGVIGGAYPLAPVKSAAPLPKAVLPRCMEVLRRARVRAPVTTGQIIAGDILDTGIDIVACGNVPAKQ